MTKNTTPRAEVTTVKIGEIEIEGLLLEDGSFAIAVPQVAALSLVPPNRSLKQLQALLGISFSSHQKAKTGLNSKTVSVISLADFGQLLCAADRKLNNPHAIAFRDLLAGLSLHQLFSDSFKLKFDADDRQAWLTVRTESVSAFKVLTGAIATYYEEVEHREPSKFTYSNCMDCINKNLFGLKAKQIKEAEGVTKGGLTRDLFSPSALAMLTAVQKVIAHRIKEGDGKPYSVCKAVISSGMFPAMPYK